MILIDAGPLIALIDKAQAELHQNCVSALNELSGTLITTWPCFTEAMYFAGELRGWPGQSALWQYVEQDELTIHIPTIDEWKRMRWLMEQYKDTPMDLADSSLVTLAETHNLHQIFTIDSDFYVYKIHGAHPFEVIYP